MNGSLLSLYDKLNDQKASDIRSRSINSDNYSPLIRNKDDDSLVLPDDSQPSLINRNYKGSDLNDISPIKRDNILPSAVDEDDIKPIAFNAEPLSLPRRPEPLSMAPQFINPRAPYNMMQHDHRWHKHLNHECDRLKDHCCKHILLDIYCKILPLDNDYVRSHQYQMQGDINNFLNDKGMDGYQYITSCKEKTNAPLLEYILRSADNVGKRYIEEVNEEDMENRKHGVSLPPKEAEADDDDDVDDEIVDVKNDAEYKSFVNTLKKKTMNKIVDDVSTLINNKKDEKNMKFDPQKGAVRKFPKSSSDPGVKFHAKTPDELPEEDNDIKPDENEHNDKNEQDDADYRYAPEHTKMTLQKLTQIIESPLSVCMNWANLQLIKEGIDYNSTLNEELIGLSIREATLNQIDTVFNQPSAALSNFAYKIKSGRGSVMNESAINNLIK